MYVNKHFVNDHESLVFTCSFLGPMLFGCLMALLVWSVFQIFLPPGPVQNTIFSLLGSILFSAYIVYDTDNLIQRKLFPCCCPVCKQMGIPASIYCWYTDGMQGEQQMLSCRTCHLNASSMNLLGCPFLCQCCNTVLRPMLQPLLPSSRSLKCFGALA